MQIKGGLFMADTKPESTTIHVNTEDLKEVEGDM